MVVAGWETMRVEITQPVQTNVDEVGPAPSTYDEKLSHIIQILIRLLQRV